MATSRRTCGISTRTRQLWPGMVGAPLGLFVAGMALPGAGVWVDAPAAGVFGVLGGVIALAPRSERFHPPMCRCSGHFGGKGPASPGSPNRSGKGA